MAVVVDEERRRRWRKTLDAVTEYLDENLQIWFPDARKLAPRSWLFFLDGGIYFSGGYHFPLSVLEIGGKYYPGRIAHVPDLIAYKAGWRREEVWEHLPVLAGLPPWKG